MEKNEKTVAIKNLAELLEEYTSEKKSLEERIQLNDNSILELKSFLDKLCSKEAEDYKFFSPRTPSALHQDNIFENRNKISFLENENHNIYVDLGILDKKIKKIAGAIDVFQLMLKEADQEKKTIVNNGLLSEKEKIKQDVNNEESIINSNTNGNIINNSNNNTEIINSDILTTNSQTIDGSKDTTTEVGIKVSKDISDNEITLDKILTKKSDTNNIQNLGSISKTNIDLGISALFIQEKERERIARDLHDTSLQNLTHMIHKIELASKFIDQDSIRAKLEIATIIKGLRETIQEIRNTIYNLRPMTIKESGFIEIMNKLKDEYRSKSNCNIIFQIMEPNDCEEIFKVTLYRIIDEAICNSLKHANATELLVDLKDSKEKIVIKIEDNGIGFDEEVVLKNQDHNDLHFGVKIMKERVLLIGGIITIKRDNGTKILIEIPKTGGNIND